MTSHQLHRSPMHLLHQVGQCAGDIFAAEIDGLTPRQLAVLMTVAQNEGLSQTEIVNSTGIDRSTMTDVVRRLKKKGLVQRRRSRQDARAYAVTITDEGRRVLSTAEPLAKKVDQRILHALPGKQRERFMEQLQAIVETLQRLQTATTSS